MFDELDDPRPPRPGPSHRDAVHQRMVQIRRRRRLVVGLPAAVCLTLALTVGVVLVTRHEPAKLQVVSEGPPITSPDEVERARRDELISSGDGEVVSDVVINRPTEGYFDRTVLVELDDGTTAILTRLEPVDLEMDDLREQFGDAGSVTTGGRPYAVNPDDPGSLIWYVGPNLAISVQVPEGTDPVAVLDGLVYEPPSSRCVVADRVTDTGGCTEGEYVIEGSDDRETVELESD